MIAYYGYKDGSGDYYISFDTQKCAACELKPCLEACPLKIMEKFPDDYGDEVAGIKDEYRRRLKYVCAPCKPVSGPRTLQCCAACPAGAINHSW